MPARASCVLRPSVIVNQAGSLASLLVEHSLLSRATEQVCRRMFQTRDSVASLVTSIEQFRQRTAYIHSTA